MYNDPGTRVPVSAGGPGTHVRVRVHPPSAGSGSRVQILRPECNSTLPLSNPCSCPSKNSTCRRGTAAHRWIIHGDQGCSVLSPSLSRRNPLSQSPSSFCVETPSPLPRSRRTPARAPLIPSKPSTCRRRTAAHRWITH